MIEIKMLEELSNQNIDLAKRYAAARMKSANAKYNLDVIYASRIKDLQEKRKNIGYEAGLINLMESGDEEIATYYEDMLRYTATYKGLEILIKAHKDKISLYQSKWKFQSEGERYG